MKHKICEDCKKKIEGGFYTMASLEPKDFNRKFYVCTDCIKNYGKEENQGN